MKVYSKTKSKLTVGHRCKVSYFVFPQWSTIIHVLENSETDACHEHWKSPEGCTVSR